MIRLVSRATWTSGEPVSPSWWLNSSMILFFSSGVMTTAVSSDENEWFRVPLPIRVGSDWDWAKAALQDGQSPRKMAQYRESSRMVA